MGILLNLLSALRSSGMPVLLLPAGGAPHLFLRESEAEAEGDPGVGEMLRDWHTSAQEDLGGAPLPFHEQAARGGAQTLFRCVWCYLNRDLDSDTTVRLLESNGATPQTPEIQFSADLSLRYLPAVFRMAETLAPGDSLLTCMRHLAWCWPLSGVGILSGNRHGSGSGEGNLADAPAFEALRKHQGLWQLFQDRVVEFRARAWLGCPDTAAALKGSLGAYFHDLAPGLDYIPELSDSDL